MKAFTGTRTRILGCILACMGLTALAVQPMAAHAANLTPVTMPAATTMHESYRVLQTGAKVPGAGSATITLKKGSKNTLTAPDAITGTTGLVYRFLFWDIAGRLFTHRTATFAAPTHQAAFLADAWYLLTGGGPCPSTGCPPPSVETYAFSLHGHKPLPESPIASVVPVSPSVWAPPSATVYTAATVTISAANSLDSLLFVKWRAFSKGATASDTQLNVGAGVSTIAIAFYGPDPCEGILDDAPYPWEFPTAAAYQAAVRANAAAYHACEVSHGA